MLRSPQPKASQSLARPLDRFAAVPFAAALVRAPPQGGISILRVEQNARLAPEPADRAYLLEHRRILMSGPAEEMARDARILETYPGKSVAATTTER